MKNQKYPICEVYAQYPATSFSWFCDRGGEGALTGKWKFVCGCTSGVETYYVDMIDLAREMLSELYPVESR